MTERRSMVAHHVFITGALAVCVLGAACAPEGPIPGTSLTTVSFAIISDGSFEKLVTNKLEFVKVTLASVDSGETLTETKPYATDLTVSFSDVAIGKWKVTVELVIDGVTEQEAGLRFDVAEDQIVRININLRSFSSGFGELSLSVEVLDDAVHWRAKDVAPSNFNTCALSEDGKVFCWGKSFNDLPTQVTGFSGPIASIHAGRDQSCVILETAGIECFHHARDTHPSAVPGLTGKFHQMVLGGGVSCAADLAGALTCWSGELDGFSMVPEFDALPVEGIAEPIAELFHAPCGWTPDTCSEVDALLKNGTLVNIKLQYESPPTGQMAPVRIIGTALPIEGYADLQAATSSIDGRCGLFESQGETTLNCTSGLSSPLVMGSVNASVAAFHSFKCAAALGSTDVRCWGFAGGSSDSPGEGFNYGATPVAINGITGQLSKLGVGARHACAINEAGDLFCWGRNDLGQLGIGTGNTYHYDAVLVNQSL